MLCGFPSRIWKIRPDCGREEGWRHERRWQQSLMHAIEIPAPRRLMLNEGDARVAEALRRVWAGQCRPYGPELPLTVDTDL